MANAEQQDDKTSQTSTDNKGSPGLDKVTAELATVQAQLEQMNASFRAMAEANKPQRQVVQEQFADPTYDTKKYTEQVLAQADKIAAAHLQRERQLNATIYTLAQDYPEISTDAKLKAAVTEAQMALPESIRETPAGIEAAILKAVTKAGLMPKSRRQVVDDDISAGSGRNSSGSSSGSRRAKVKVNDDMLALASLMGRDVTDEKVLKGLEEAANRETWNRYK